MDPRTGFDLQPTLVGPSVSLRPLVADDLEPLAAAAADPLIWEQHPQPTRHQRPVFEVFFREGLESGGGLLVTDNLTGAAIGCSRFYEWNPLAREVAIGYTFLVRSHWGRGSNPEMKGLMLRHAFQWSDTVWIHVGVHNTRSRKAVEKIGGIHDREEPRATFGVAHPYVYYRFPAPEPHAHPGATPDGF